MLSRPRMRGAEDLCVRQAVPSPLLSSLSSVFFPPAIRRPSADQASRPEEALGSAPLPPLRAIARPHTETRIV